MSAIDTQTPLAWVLTSGGPDGGPGVLGSHSFAHAYLTLPVSYPRIYSLGILEGHYVATLRHEAYRMKVVVDNSTSLDAESCWKSLNKTEKSSLMFEVVESFVSDLDEGVASQNTTSWSMCYSDPTGEDLPFSSSPLIPHTPAYVCRDERGSMKKLERDIFLKGLFAVFWGLSVGSIALQFYALSKVLHFVAFWGGESVSSLLTNSEQKIFHKHQRGFFDKTYLPVHVTVGGLLSSDILFGERAFTRLKQLLFVAGFGLLYAVWPNLLVQSILIPTSPIARLGVSSSETFGRNLPCRPNIPPGPSLALVSTGFYCVFAPFIFCLYALLIFVFSSDTDPEEMSSVFSLFSNSFIFPITSVLMTVLSSVRLVLLFPLTPPNPVVSRKKTSTFPLNVISISCRLPCCATHILGPFFGLPWNYTRHLSPYNLYPELWMHGSHRREL